MFKMGTGNTIVDALLELKEEIKTTNTKLDELKTINSEK